MSEVDKLDDTIDHRVSQCYQRINTAQRNAVNKLLDKLLHKEPMSIIPVLLISWIKRNEAVVIPQPAPLQKLIVIFIKD